ncbi:MAG: hypothetical protein P1U36_01775 [Legionellaceae bacterium]|nr:hypothetical protein [Legionellaceae bacterium]
MQRVREGLFQRQARRVLDEERYALASAAILSVLPYMGWLALALIALVTLRKGWQSSGVLVLPVMVGHTLLALKNVPISGAIFSAALNVIPCYLAAIVLGVTSSWRVVAAALFGAVMTSALCIQVISPEFIVSQYEHLQTLLRSLASGDVNVLDFWESHEVSPLVLANYLLGVQAASLAFSAMVPLLFARSIQSQLFYPGGFQQELLNFRGDKLSCAVLVLICTGAYSGQFLAINGLPLVLFYFILAGLSLAACLLSRIRPLGVLVLLLVPMVLLPWVMLPLYVLLGAFDSLFNVRLYLSSKTGKVG